MDIYSCTSSACDFKDEFTTSPSVPKDMRPPEVCPKCGSPLKHHISATGGIDVIGGYDYEYGKKSKLKDPKFKASCLVPDKDGNYKKPY